MIKEKDLKYNNGLVLGKFYGLHTGHLYTIDTALKNCQNVYIIVCHNKLQDIEGSDRIKSLTEHYIDNNITILSFEDDGLPQYPNECQTLDEFYSYWVSAVYSLVSDLDVVFTSEEYGDEFASYLGIDHFLVDKERKVFPISGTEIRQDPYSKWEFVPDTSKHLYIKRVALMGPESVGKSTLGERLSDHYQTENIIEWGSVIFEQNGNHVDLKDFIKISKIRQQDEDTKIHLSNKVLICDTEDITTYIFSKMFYPDRYQEIEGFFKEKIKNQKKYDVYILYKPDCIGFQDGTRKFLDDREKHYQVIKEHLQKNGCNYFEVGGDWEDRFKSSIGIIDGLFN